MPPRGELRGCTTALPLGGRTAVLDFRSGDLLGRTSAIDAVRYAISLGEPAAITMAEPTAISLAEPRAIT
jgi:hypothetical protein